MQGGDDVTDTTSAIATWQSARFRAIDHACKLHELGVHKAVCNRLIEPFMWHTVVVSATEWNNFFHQRCSPLAEPHMLLVANAMHYALCASNPVERERHMPYALPDDPADVQPDLCVARCARVSYLQHDGTRSIEKDLDLFKKLRTSGHWSPFEHVAWAKGGRHGNFTGWYQYRKFFAEENRTATFTRLPPA